MADETVVVNVPRINKYNDLIATVIGMGQAMTVSIGDFLVHSGPSGLDWKAPTFWIGLVMAMLAGLQGYYSNRGAQGSQVVTNQSGEQATVNVNTVEEPEVERVEKQP